MTQPESVGRGEAIWLDAEDVQRLVSAIGDLVVLVRDGVITWASPSCRDFGWTQQGLIGKPSTEFVHPDDRYLVKAAGKNRNLNYEDVRLRFRLQTAAGDSRWVEARMTAYRNSQTDPDGMICVVRDISAQVDAESALKESEREFRLLAENAADVVIRFDPKGVPLWVSSSVRDQLGWDPDRFLAKPLLNLIHPADIASAASLGTDSVLDRPSEFRIKHGLGHWVWVSKQIRTLIDGSHIEALRCIDDEVAARQAAELAMADLAYRSSHDVLTDLRTRDQVIRALEESLAGRVGADRVAVLFIDIDRFKEVNDGISHAAGDDVLRQIASRLREHVGSTECIGRLGGDEFAAVLTGLGSVDIAMARATAMRDTIAGHEFWAQGQRVPVTVSIGVAISRAGQDAHDLLSDADAALYQAKKLGRNRCELADDSTRAAAMRRIGLAGRIRSGIDIGQFHAWFQPIVDLNTQQVSGYEALARWITPDGVVSAHEFIGTAEDSGMLSELGGIVIEEAINQVPQLRPGMVMTVNASASQIEAENFAPRILQAISHCGADPTQLVIEITEHSLLNLTAAAQAGLASLTDIGISLYVDDFGTGYSSLATLLDYPVSGVKLDRAFSQRLASDPDGPASRLIAGLVDLMNQLSLRGVAEGVESPRQATLLKDLGWNYGQGWLFGRAQPPTEYPRLPSMRTPHPRTSSRTRP